MSKNLNRDKFIKEHREKGLCIECNNPISKKSICRCDNCLKRRNKNKHKNRDNAINNKLCLECYTEKCINGNSICENCYYKKVSKFHFHTSKYWKKLESIFNEQNGICKYSGIKLSIGVNAELDHIEAKSNGGKNDVENVQWVYAPVNKMKWDLTENEFKNLIVKIANNFLQRG